MGRVADQTLVDQFRTNTAIEELRRTIELAQIRSLPFEQLIERACRLVEDVQSSEIVYVIEESDRTRDQNCVLAGAIRDLLGRVDSTPRINKGRLDRQIGRLLRSLPTDLSQPIAVQCISHLRKSRRTIGLKCLDVQSVDRNTYRYLIACFDGTSDERILKILLNRPIQLNHVEPARLFAIFENDEYWQMRVMEATLRSDQALGVRLSATHPYAFVWAAGRIGDQELLPSIRACFEAATDKLRLAGIVAWACGKLAAQTDLEALRSVLEELEQLYDPNL